MTLLQRVNAIQPVLDGWLNRPFVWGADDCAHLCASVLFAMGHKDPLSDVGPYATQRGAKRQLKKAGYADLDEAIDRMGFERIPPAMALPGDLVALDGVGGWTALGFAVGQGRAVAFSCGFCAWGPVSDCKIAWRVPCLKL